MSLYAGLARSAYFSEFSQPYFDGSTWRSPDYQRNAALSQLHGMSTPLGTTVAGVTTTEKNLNGDSVYATKLVTSAFSLGAVGDSANLAGGALIYTLPSGIIHIFDATIVGGLTFATATPTTDTPELGLGTVIGSGANATLSTTGEDIIDGGAGAMAGGASIAPDVAGGLIAKRMLASTGGTYIAASGGKARTVHLNFADGWADLTPNTPNLLFTGTVRLWWRVL